MNARRLQALAAVAAAAALAIAAHAEAQTVTVVTSPATDAPDLDRVVVVGGGATVFGIDAATGAVTRLSGAAIRLTTASATTPTVSISCSGDVSACASQSMQVSISAVGGAGDADFTQFSVSNLSNATFMGGAPAPAASLNFSLNPIGALTATFSLGARVSVSGTAASGPHSYSYLVSASLL